MLDRRALLTGAVVATIGLAGCGDDDTDQRTRIASVYADIAAAVASGDAREVCGRLGPRARDQVLQAGHIGLQECAVGMRPMLGSLRRGRSSNGSSAAPELSGADVRLSAVATVSVEGRRIEVPFVEERGEWKLDSFYGLSPRPSVAIP